jgi:hypothetical protein
LTRKSFYRHYHLRVFADVNSRENQGRKLMTAGCLRQHKRAARAMIVGAAFALFGTASAIAADPIKIGQIAALSGASAQSGEAITRG